MRTNTRMLNLKQFEFDGAYQYGMLSPDQNMSFEQR